MIFLLKTLNNSKTSQSNIILLFTDTCWALAVSAELHGLSEMVWLYYKKKKPHTSSNVRKMIEKFTILSSKWIRNNMQQCETIWNNVLCNKEHENMNALTVADLFRDNENKGCHHSFKINTYEVVMFFSSFCHFFLS